MLDDRRCELLEIAEHRHREREPLDLALERGVEALEGDRVLRVEFREAVDLHRGDRMVEHPTQVHRECLVRLLVETEPGDRTGLVPARIIVVAGGLVQAQLHVVMRPDVFAGIDHAPLEGGVDVGARGDHHRTAGPPHDLAAETRNAHLQPLEVADGVDLPPEPAGHLRGNRGARTRHDVEGGVRLLVEHESIALVVPGHHALAVHAERYGGEPLNGGLPRGPEVRSAHERLDPALGRGLEAFERLQDLAGRVDLDPEPSAAHLLDDLRQPLGRALKDVEGRSIDRGHAPLHVRLGDDVGGVDDGAAHRGRHQTASGHDEPAPFARHALPPHFATNDLSRR